MSTFPSVVSAQSYSGGHSSLGAAQQPVAEGDDRGVSLGALRLHPGLAIGGGYNSNVFYEEELEGVESSAVLRLRPSLRLATPSPESVRLTANLQLLWEYYPSGEQFIREQSGIDVLGDLGIQFAPRGVASVTLYDIIRRYSDSPSSPGGETRSHIYNEVGGVLAFHPGGSQRTSRRGFTADLTAGYGLEIWDEELALDRSIILSRLQVKYFFLPKTALTLRAGVRSVTYDQRERPVNFGDDDPLGIGAAFQGTQVNVDSTPLRFTLALSGLLTKHIDFSLEGGYSLANYAEGEDLSTWVANVRFGVFFTPDAHLSIGWEHGFEDSSFANYYEYDRFSGRLEVTAGDFLVGGRGGFETQRFATVDVPTVTFGGNDLALYSTGDREDPVVTGGAFVGWNPTGWARFLASYDMRANLTDFVVTTGRPSGPDRQDTSASQYIIHEVYFTTEFEY